jgi:hypothetical protein
MESTNFNSNGLEFLYIFISIYIENQDIMVIFLKNKSKINL